MGLWGSFLCNSHKERAEMQIEQDTLPIWMHITFNTSRFQNPFYKARSRPIMPVASFKAIHFWNEFFFRFESESITNPSSLLEEVRTVRPFAADRFLAWLVANSIGHGATAVPSTLATRA